MSFSMYARPAPVNLPEPEYLGQLKYKLARRLWDHDGSLRSEPELVGRELLPYLEGMRDGASGNLSEDAGKLIDLIEANAQGVLIWVGDSIDY